MTYKPSEWDLTHLVSDRNKLDKHLEMLEKLLQKVEIYKTKFKPTISNKEFNNLIDDLEKYDKLAGTLSQYAHLWFSENTTNKEAIAFKNKIQNIRADHSNRMLWFDLDFIKFPKKDCDRLIKGNKKADYNLSLIIKNKDYILSDKEEKVINIKDANGIVKLKNIYDLLTGSFVFEFRGKKLSQEELLNYVRNSDPELRKDAYESLFKKYIEYENILGEIYSAVITDWFKEDVELRGYKSPISVRNKGNDIEDKAIDTLMKVYRKNLKLFHRYFKIKAKEIGMKKIRRYDIYAPITKIKEKISYEDGTEIVLNTFKEFSQDFYFLADKMFKEKHIHSLIQKGKASGAYNYGVNPEIDPYIMLTYVGDSRSVSTLAHEVGHGIHFMLAAKKNSIFHVHAALPIAETASVFSELLLIEKLKERKPQLRKQLLFEQLDNAYATIARQLHFVDFEIKAHGMARKNVSVQDLNKEYYKMLKEHFGDSVEISECFASEWSYISHIFDRPFYCYAYGFGNLLSFAVYAKYKEEKNKYVNNVIKMLSDGGSKSPRELVKELGFNINSEEFWQKGFDVVKSMIDELEKTQK